MQLIVEVFDVMKNAIGLDNSKILQVFVKWDLGRLESYLIEITTSILAKKDAITNKGDVVDSILDKTGSKGTEEWTAQEAVEASVAALTIAGALDPR